MKILDKILEQLQDSQWHNLDEIRKSICLPSDKLNLVVCFLEKQSFVNMKSGKLKITYLGLKFLYL
jgi:hypothetical protein